MRIVRLTAWTIGACFLAVAAVAAEMPVPGQRFEVRPADLPPPYATPSARNSSRLARLPPGASLQVPDGFRATIFADGLAHPRNLVVAADGTVFLAQSREGEVTLLRDTDGSGAADFVVPFITGLLLPHGLAIWDGYLYVADSDYVRRFLISGNLRAPMGPSAGEVLTARGAFGSPPL